MIKIADGGKLIIKIDGDTKGFYDKAGDIDKYTNKALKNIAKGATVTTAAIAAVGTMSIKSFADYEQLVGGVDTLFKESSKKLQGYAAEAYKTAGISANTYMQNATSFSASLLSSLAGDTEKAADIANMAMIDMSDNANKMGTSMESITNAYQGFAKQQYMLLDNLKLGYGGTKTEMERLLKDAETLSGVKYDINNLADVYEAIHVIQTELGITGTTAKEASTTITGSINMAKAALDNLLVGISDPTQDIDVLVDNFVNSVKTVIDNVLPRIKAVASELSSLLIKHMPEGFKIAISAIAAFGVALVGLKIGLVVNDIANLIKGVKGFTAATELGAAAQKVMNAQLLANPYALAATALAALTAGVAVYAATHKSAASEIRKAYDEEIKAIDDATAAEMAQAETADHLRDRLFELEKQIHSGTLTDKEAEKVKADFNATAEQLNSIIPGIISNIGNETDAYYVQEYAINSLTDSFINLARAKAMANAYQAKLDATASSLADTKEELKKYENGEKSKYNENYIEWFGKKYVLSTNGYNKEYLDLLKEKEGFEKTMDGYITEIGNYQDQITDIVGEGEKERTEITKNGIDTRTASTKKAGKEQSDILKEQQEQELRDLKHALEMKLITEKDYYKGLAKFRDQYFQEGSEEWQDYTEEIFKYYKQQASEAIEEIGKIQGDLIDTFDDHMKLTRTVTVENWFEDGSALTWNELNTSTKELDEIKEYVDKLNAAEERLLANGYGEKFVNDYMAKIREMSVEDGLEYVRLLTSADDSTFNKHIGIEFEKENTFRELAASALDDETEELQKEIVSAFEEINSDLELSGEESASTWVKSFLAEIKELMPDVVSEITSAFNNLVVSPTLSLSGAMGGTTTTNSTFSPSYNFYGASGESTSMRRARAKNDALMSYMAGV